MELFHDQPHWVRAGTYGFLSAASLPLGAMMGVVLAPVDVRSTALVVAFGAGALLFAVATELYAEALRQVTEEGHDTAIKEIVVMMVCAILGAIMFTEMNMWLSEPDAGEKHSHVRKRLPDQGEGAALLHAGDFAVESARGKSARSSGTPRSGAGGSVALSMWLGVAMDGVPESMLIGFITNERAMTVAFLVAIFIANFPEAFASASMLKKQGMSTLNIVLMWGSLCLLTMSLAAVSSFLLPENVHSHEHAEMIHLFGSAVEGLAGGAMLAMVCATMLPEAFHVGGHWSGLVAVMGFLCACSVKVIFGRAPGGNDHAVKAVLPVDELDLAKGLADNVVREAAHEVGHTVTEVVSFLAALRP